MAPVSVEISGACARLRLCRPEAGNALRGDVVGELLGGLRIAERTPGCCAVVLTAEGDSFCSGIDLSIVESPGSWTAVDGRALWELLSGLATSPLVTVAVVDGRATGGGVGLASSCDFVLAGPNARFRLTELLIGLVPALITPFVSARIGTREVFRRSVLADELDAAEAHALGLADEVVEEPEEALRRILRALRRMPRPEAVGDLKSCHRILDPLPEDYFDHAHRMFERAVTDPGVRSRVQRLREEGLL
ncbi:enoyl-CoA hydratase/isomerase family protein [Saccharopolyspora sp. WRP15-2]|uniref:Enoyl-CoA hydratase/isomerase family protein n=1 Tax=Saccharopolyspora oryzae TaxID=2997343 RepID=A0ABT4V0V9_9PSEU|nr:enoyl-CoA hydratase/isomerase family protein [Saccharopolyspora oryzae]MDA3627076.1 enoyl-CoA hydratase/isomerase family protein [Saccharopolyspora oryzae]